MMAVIGAVPDVAQAQHPPINLFDDDFNIINPITGENATEPFSTENTCGTCHDYKTVTSGYHFQMGWNKVSDTFGASSRQPWSLSDGFMGKWYPFSYRQLAKKHNSSPDEIDLTVYDFVGFSRTGQDQPPCGSCHPGGGGLEYDRDGKRYDQNLREHPDLRDSLDGDYYHSNWDKSGVVEADCLLCHLAPYDFDERISQLEKGNYRWAVVAGTGFGIVKGSVKDGQTPTVTYNKRFFNADGTITLPISWPPPSKNCVYCHGTSDVKKRGFSWDDIHNPDVHQEQGLACVACHTAELDHNITKGDTQPSTVAANLDNTMRDCRGCHYTGYMGATYPRHTSIRPSHLKRIACESCHIPSLHRAAALGFETTTGQLVFTKNPPQAKSFGAAAEWKPVYERNAKQILFPYNDVLAIWWGNLDRDGIVYPLFLREQATAWKVFSNAVTDDNGDGRPEVNRDPEIVAGLKAFEQTLKGSKRFHRVQPVLVKGGKAYHLDSNGQLALLDYDLSGLDDVSFSVSHNVAPSRMALGANGCSDCHAEKANFFMGRRVVDLYGTDGKPISESMGAAFGCNPVAFMINSLHQQIISPVVSFGVILVVFLIVVHYHSYGPKRIPFVPFSGEVKRFSLLERGIHLSRLISFVLLAGTGLILAFNLTAWQELFFNTPDQVRSYHIVFGVIFIVTTVMGIVIWFKDAVFADYDKEWVRKIGGYLGYKGEVPSGRFNAGQKMFYWYTAVFGLFMGITGVVLVFMDKFSLATACLTSTFHNLVGFFLIAGVLGHAYLGTIANPGTWRVLVDGYVTREWAKHHHPNWFRSLMRKKQRDDDQQEDLPFDDPDDQ